MPTLVAELSKSGSYKNKWREIPAAMSAFIGHSNGSDGQMIHALKEKKNWMCSIWKLDCSKPSPLHYVKTGDMRWVSDGRKHGRELSALPWWPVMSQHHSDQRLQWKWNTVAQFRTCILQRSETQVCLPSNQCTLDELLHYNWPNPVLRFQY